MGGLLRRDLGGSILNELLQLRSKEYKMVQARSSKAKNTRLPGRNGAGSPVTIFTVEIPEKKRYNYKNPIRSIKSRMKQRTVYVCTKCDYQYPKLLGRCPQCGAFGSFVEEKYEDAPEPAAGGKAPRRGRVSGGGAVKIAELSAKDSPRSATGYGELDRVLGGGLVDGSVVLLSGEPGIGKSTILLQISGVLAKTRRVLYVSGEESGSQLKLRAERLGVSSDGLFIYTETDVDRIVDECERLSPDVVVADSIQTLSCDSTQSSPGSV